MNRTLGVLISLLFITACTNQDSASAKQTADGAEALQQDAAALVGAEVIMSSDDAATDAWQNQAALTADQLRHQLGLFKQSVFDFKRAITQDNLQSIRSSFRQLYLDWVAFEPYAWSLKSIGYEALLWSVDSRSLLPGYIDRIPGYDETGIINDSVIDIAETSLRAQHLRYSEEEAALGFRTLEFLIFGLQDQPRTLADFESGVNAQRRLEYFVLVVDLLEKDLMQLVNAWSGVQSQTFAWSTLSLSEKYQALNTSFKQQKDLLLQVELSAENHWPEQIQHDLDQQIFAQRLENVFSSSNSEYAFSLQALAGAWPSEDANRSLRQEVERLMFLQ